MITQATVTGVILSGGEGRRLEGRDKGLEPVGGAPLVSLVRSRLVAQVDRIIISANRHLDEYAAWGDPVVSDEVPGLGPLGGLRTALDHVSTAVVFCCPGDAPLLPTDLVARMGLLLDDSTPLVAVHDGHRRQPLFLLFHARLRPSLAAFLARGGRAAHDWIDSIPHAELDASDERSAFVNLNSPVDLDRFRQQVAASC